MSHLWDTGEEVRRMSNQEWKETDYEEMLWKERIRYEERMSTIQLAVSSLALVSSIIVLVLTMT